MDKKPEKNYRSSLIVDSARENAQHYQRENLKARRKNEDDFFKQEIDYRNLVFAPEGYEGLMLSLYAATIPYLAGLGFLFLFVAEASYEYFLEFNLASYFVIWAIGYEVCAVLILVGIFLAWLRHLNGRWSREQARKTPKDRYGF
jgi:hypothetical protein